MQGNLLSRLAPLCVVILAVLVVYHGALWVFFTQDDLVWLRIAENFRSLDGVLQVFFQYNGAGNYRPLTQELFFLSNLKLFGLNPVAFHASALLIHIINSLLVYAILQLLFSSRLGSVAGAVFYGANVTLFISVYWVSAVSESGMATFFLLSTYCFIRFLQVTSIKWYLLSFLFFVAAMMSKETAIALPPILLCLYVYMYRKSGIFKEWHKPVIYLFPYGFVVLAYLAIRVITIGMTPDEGPYNASFGLHTPVILARYLVWSLNGFQLVDALATHTGHWNRLHYYLPTFILFLAALIYFARAHTRTLLLSTCWFVIALLPVLPFADHVQNYYVNTATVAISILVAVAVGKSGKAGVFLAGIGIPLYLVISLVNVNYQEQHSWVTHRSEIARSALEDIKNLYPTLPAGTVLYIHNTTEEEYWAWNFGDLYRLYYHDNSLEVLFGDRSPVPVTAGNVIELEWVDGSLQAVSEGVIQTSPALPDILDFSLESDFINLGEGWHQAEPGHRWMSQQGTVSFSTTPGVQTSYILTILGSLNTVYYENEMVELTVSTDGQILGTHTIAEGGAFTVELEFEGVFDETLDLALQLDKSFVPSEVSDSQDSRELGMSVNYIRLKRN